MALKYLSPFQFIGMSNVDNWFPGCLEELIDLPCFVIYAGRDRAGQTFPR